MPVLIALPASSAARTDALCVEPIGYPPIPEKSPLNKYA
jgi:hypothetical protein